MSKEDRFNRIKEILFGALDRAEEDRAAYLDRACADDAALRAEIDRKLARLVDEPGILRSTGIGAFLGDNADLTLPDAGATLAQGQTTPTRDIGSSIGPYRIVKILGEGGMGVVFEAEQQNPRRRVALKLIRGGRFVDEGSIRMFQREIDTLARLKHPNIGAIYESGRTEDGQHFFAMELVRGRSLDEYLLAHKTGEGLSSDELRSRLELFAGFAEAVRYAHQRGVIHRDLKPANILVVDEDASAGGSRSGAPDFKILDFGLARITDSDVAATMVSEVGVIKGTLTHMSPEQARGNPAEIDTRTDVYSLGVILYEMLTGRLPNEIPSGSLMEGLRVIAEAPPRPMSESYQGRKPIDSDIETICFKALEKNPGDRYESAATLADDVRRYLASEPIVARPPSTMYQLRKLAARNKPIVFGVLATLVVLILGAVTSTTLAIREAAQRRHAEAEAERATEVQEFMQEMIANADPSQGKGPLITMGEVLSAATAKVDSSFPDKPGVRASLRFSIGRAYAGFSQWEDAREHFEKAVADFREAYTEDRFETAEALRMLGETYAGMNAPETAAIARESYEMHRRLNGDLSLSTAYALHDLAYAEYRAAMRSPDSRDSLLALSEECYLRSQPAFAENYGERSPEYARCFHAYSVTLWAQKRREEAIETLGKALRIVENAPGDNDWFLESLYQDRAVMSRNVGDFDTAEEMARKALASRVRIWGEGSLQEFWSLTMLGDVLFKKGEFEEALIPLEKAVSVDTVALGSYLAEDLPEALGQVVEVYEAIGDPERGREFGRELLKRRLRAAQSSADDADAQLAAARVALNVWPPDLRDPSAALRFATRACELTGDEDADALRLLGEAQLRAGREREAAASLERALAQTAADDEDARAELQELISSAHGAGGW